MTKDAIQPDASNNSPAIETEPNPHDERLNLVEGIADRAHAEREDNHELPPGDDNPAEPKQSVEPKPATILETSAPPVMHKVKVDGKEVEVSEEEMIKNYQIESAARTRLNESSEARKQLEADQSAFEQEKKEYKEQQVVKPVVEKELQPPVVKTSDAENLRKAFDAWGEDDDAGFDKAADQFFAERQAPPVAPVEQQLDAVTMDQVDDRIKAGDEAKEIQRQFERARDEFLEGNQRIAETPFLMKMVQNILPTASQESQTYQEAFSKVAEQINDGLSDWNKVEPGNERLERKLDMASEPVKKGIVATPTPEPPADTHQSIIAEMKQQRGQSA